VSDAHPPDRAVPFAFVDDLDEPVLAPDDHHHLARVRRLRDGDDLVVGDGHGRHRRVRFGARLTPIGEIRTVPLPTPTVSIAFALTKGDRPEMVVQKLTEIGVDCIVPFVADRTIVQWDGAKAARNLARLRVVAREAAAQAHRPWLPDVGDLATFDEVVADPLVALAEPGGAGPSLGTTSVAVGPEGGWSPGELARAASTVDLGPTVLRAETAAIAAGVLLTALRDRRLPGTERG